MKVALSSHITATPTISSRRFKISSGSCVFTIDYDDRDNDDVIGW